MQTISLVFAAVLPVFLVVGCGVVIRRIGWLNEEADKSLMTLVINLLYPALIFSFILGNDALRQSKNLIVPPLFGFVSVLVIFALGLILARVWHLGNSQERRTFAFTTGIYNYGYFAIPVTALLFDRETIGLILVHNQVVDISMSAVVVGFILGGQKSHSLLQKIFSPPVISIFVAVPLNLIGGASFLPEFLLDTIQLLADCAIPIALILIGATFADLARGLQFHKRVNIALGALALRAGIFPILYLFLAWSLPISIELKKVMLVQAAMPCAVFPIVLSRHFHGSPEVAFRTVITTTVLSLITIPLWVGIGFFILGF